jgi:hypothetical protein
MLKLMKSNMLPHAKVGVFCPVSAAVVATNPDFFMTHKNPVLSLAGTVWRRLTRGDLLEQSGVASCLASTESNDIEGDAEPGGRFVGRTLSRL